MTIYSIEFSSFAKSDLSDIWEYLVLYDENIADSFIVEVRERIQDLQTFPFMGSIHEDLENEERHLLHKKYNIIYVVEDKNIIILRILHSSRKITNFL